MSRRGPRGLTPEERDLWEIVASRTAAMHPSRPQPLARPAPSKPLQKPDLTPAIAPFNIGQKRGDTSMGHSLAPPMSEHLARQAIQMDKKHYGKLKRGKLKPEARIDLHGMTLDRAHGVLNRFILDAAAHGLRLVLVITGKGKDKFDDGPIPTRRGVLKHHVPGWLTSPALRNSILQITEAHLKHGGSGAYYVYLRRHR